MAWFQDIKAKDRKLDTDKTQKSSLSTWTDGLRKTDFKAKDWKLEDCDSELRKEKLQEQGNSKMRTVNPSCFLLLYFLLLDNFSFPLPFVLFPSNIASFEMCFLLLPYTLKECVFKLTALWMTNLEPIFHHRF